MNLTTTPPVHSGNGAELLDQVRDALTRYAVLSDDYEATALALWVAATHGVPAWEHAPRLIIRPAGRMVRSHLILAVEALTHRPVFSDYASASVLSRILCDSPQDPPTLLVNEADTALTDAPEAAELRALLNAGFGRGRPVLRYNAALGEVESLPTFAMAALAASGPLPASITERAVTVTLHRPAPGESTAYYSTRHHRPVMAALQGQLGRWLGEDMEALRAAVPTLPVEDRAADLWEPLIAVADLAGGHWPDDARQAAVALTVPALTV